MTSAAMRARYEGAFLESLDLRDRDSFTLTISGITEPRTERDSKKKLIEEAIVSFAEARKRLILGKTNWRVLATLFGKDEARWVGQRVKLQCRYIDCFGDKDVPCIRIIPPDGTPLQKGVSDFMGTKQPKYVSPVERQNLPAPAAETQTIKSPSELAIGLLNAASTLDDLEAAIAEIGTGPWTEEEGEALQAHYRQLSATFE